MQQHIHCPQCQHEINIESALAEQIEARYRSQWSLRSDELNKREYDLHARQTVLDTEAKTFYVAANPGSSASQRIKPGTDE